MRKCPACGKWALDFDEYFARFRCFNPACRWMPRSSTEREISLLRSLARPTEIDIAPIPELGLTLRSSYDAENDALLFDLGFNEPSFELPEGDGRMVWKIGRQSGSVIGFAILNAKEIGVSQVRIDLHARKEGIERALRQMPHALVSARVSKVLIESVEVTAHSDQTLAQPPYEPMTNAFNQAISKFESSAMAR